MDKASQASVGRASFRATLRAIPVPLLVTVTVNPMASPAETEALSADLATSMAAPRTSTEAEAVSEPSLVVVTSAVLSTGEEPAVAAAVGEDNCLSLHDALPISEGPQLRVPPAMAQVVYV